MDIQHEELRAAAAALVAKVDAITSDDFHKGAERPEREHLRAVLLGDAVDPDGMPWDVWLLERIYRVPAEPREQLLHTVDLMLRYYDC